MPKTREKYIVTLANESRALYSGVYSCWEAADLAVKAGNKISNPKELGLFVDTYLTKILD
jgi:hypothetical protein